MTEDIAVVKPHYLKEEAYNMGFERFEGMELEDDEEFDLAPFRDSATYANHVLPSLRAMAGFADGGKGTHTIHRQVAAVKPGCEEDEPAEAQLTDARFIFEELVEAWDCGAYDAVEGNGRGNLLEDL